MAHSRRLYFSRSWSRGFFSPDPSPSLCRDRSTTSPTRPLLFCNRAKRPLGFARSPTALSPSTSLPLASLCRRNETRASRYSAQPLLLRLVNQPVPGPRHHPSEHLPAAHHARLPRFRDARFAALVAAAVGYVSRVPSQIAKTGRSKWRDPRSCRFRRPAAKACRKDLCEEPLVAYVLIQGRIPARPVGRDER